VGVFFGYIIKWWLVSVIIGLVAFPVSFLLFKRSQEKGYLFSKIIGIFLISYFSWLLGFLNFSTASIIIVTLALAGLSGYIFVKNKAEILDFINEKTSIIIISELFYLMIFLVYAFFRMYQPDIVGTEKFMDFAFMNSIVKASHMPPFDPWMFGKGLFINYYYFGYLMMAIMFKLTGVPMGMGFNLALTFTVALSALGIVGLLYNLTKNFLIGMLAAAFLLLISNIDGFMQVASNQWGLSGFNWWHTSRIIDYAKYDVTINEFPFFSFLLGDLHPHQMAIPFVLLALNIALSYLKWNDNKLVEKKMEKILFIVFNGLVLGGLWFLNSWDFPTYLFVTFLCMISYKYSNSEKDEKWWLDAFYATGLIILVFLIAYLPFILIFRSPVSIKSGLVGPVKANTRITDYLIIFGIMLFPIVSFLITRTLNWIYALRLQGIAGSKVKKRNDYCPNCNAEIREGKLICGQCGYVVTGEELHLGGEELPVKKANQGAMSFFKFLIEPTSTKDKKLFISIAAAFAVALILIVVKTIFDFNANCPECDKHFAHLGLFSGVMFLMLSFVFLLGITKLEQKENQFILILVFTAFFAALGCDLFHIIDTFSRAGQHSILERMNTVFKFYYQSWIMYSIAAAYAFFWMKHFYLRFKPAYVRWTWYGAFIILIVLGMFYPIASSNVKTGGFSTALNLDGTDFLKDRLYEGRMTATGDYEAINWIRQNIKGSPVITEAWGGEYTDYARVSSFTGLPTIIGWPGHELQWRGSGEEAGRRQAAVGRIYETLDINEAQSLLNQYDAKYVYVGALERDKYPNAQALAKFSQFMDIVYTNKYDTIIYKTR
jgi:uncharacterized membrane protein